MKCCLHSPAGKLENPRAGETSKRRELFLLTSLAWSFSSYLGTTVIALTPQLLPWHHSYCLGTTIVTLVPHFHPVLTLSGCCRSKIPVSAHHKGFDPIRARIIIFVCSSAFQNPGLCSVSPETRNPQTSPLCFVVPSRSWCFLCVFHCFYLDSRALFIPGNISLVFACRQMEGQ